MTKMSMAITMTDHQGINPEVEKLADRAERCDDDADDGTPTLSGRRWRAQPGTARSPV